MRDDALARKLVERLVVGPEDRSRCDGIHADLGRELARERARQPDQSRLGDAVDDVVLERALGVDVGDVDDRALRLLRARGAAACAMNSGARRLAPIRSSQSSTVISPTGVWKNARSVVDQRVEPAEDLHRLVDQRRQLAEIEQIGLDQRDRLLALVVQLGLQQSRFAGRCCGSAASGWRRPRAAVGRLRLPTRLAPPVTNTTLPCTRRPGYALVNT